MLDRDLFERLPADGITEFLVKSDGCLAGVHAEFSISEVTGNVLRKDHKSASDPLPLHIIGDGHLAQTDGKSIHSGQKTASEELLVFKSAHKNIVLLLVQFLLIKGQAERLPQYFIAQVHHLLVLLRSVIYHPKRHAVTVFRANPF